MINVTVLKHLKQRYFHRQINPFDVMKATQILYQNIVDQHKFTLRKSRSYVYQFVCSYFVIYCGFLVEIIMN